MRLALIMEADCIVSEARMEGEETASVIEKDCAFSAAEVKLEHRLTRIMYCKRLRDLICTYYLIKNEQYCML